MNCCSVLKVWFASVSICFDDKAFQERISSYFELPQIGAIGFMILLHFFCISYLQKLQSDEIGGC